MGTAAAELDGLREIPLPAPVSYAPQTAAWLIVGILLLAAIAWVLWRRHRRWVADRYRRTALAELAAIERNPGMAAAALPALVKRTALAFTPRSAIARLTDAEWLAFLDRPAVAGQTVRLVVDVLGMRPCGIRSMPWSGGSTRRRHRRTRGPPTPSRGG